MKDNGNYEAPRISFIKYDESDILTTSNIHTCSSTTTYNNLDLNTCTISGHTDNSLVP